MKNFQKSCVSVVMAMMLVAGSSGLSATVMPGRPANPMAVCNSPAERNSGADSAR